MAKITIHPGGFIKRNYIDELGLKATELADALEVSESTRIHRNLCRDSPSGNARTTTICCLL